MAEIKQQTKRVPALAWVGLLFCACAAIGSDVPLGAQQDCSVADTAHTGFGEIGQVQAMRAALEFSTTEMDFGPCFVAAPGSVATTRRLLCGAWLLLHFC